MPQSGGNDSLLGRGGTCGRPLCCDSGLCGGSRACDGLCARLRRGGAAVAVRSVSPLCTKIIGSRLGCALRPGDAVYLYGDVGAGKTVFVSGIAAALGAGDYITSPTFAIANEYKGKYALYHFDAYRIKSPDEMIETGFFDLAGGDGVVAVEWAQNLRGAGAGYRVEVNIDAVADRDDYRDITILY